MFKKFFLVCVMTATLSGCVMVGPGVKEFDAKLAQKFIADPQVVAIFQKNAAREAKQHALDK